MKVKATRSWRELVAAQRQRDFGASCYGDGRELTPCGHVA